jgi:hypothetical protein
MAAVFRRDWRPAGCRTADEASVIDAYVDALLGALRHDRPLARRLRREVEDHLWEAVAADPSEEGREAQRRAIAGFGDPRLIAA